nr:unnamed protein product [Spirometra erinaceieuropaei]
MVIRGSSMNSRLIFVYTNMQRILSTANTVVEQFEDRKLVLPEFQLFLGGRENRSRLIPGQIFGTEIDEVPFVGESTLSEDMDGVWSQFEETVHNLISNHCPIMRKTLTNRPRWLTPSSKKEVDEKSKLWKRSLTDGTPESFKSYDHRETGAKFSSSERNRIQLFGPSTLEDTTIMETVQFTEGMVLTELLRLKESKSPGPDEIPAKILKELAGELAKPLSTHFHTSFETGHLPPDWKSAWITPLYKDGSRVSANNYRPVSLTCIYYNPRSNRPERRTALVARELARYKVDIAALSETRFSEQGQLQEMCAGYTFFRSGRPKAERRDAGVAFAIRNDIVGRLPSLPQGINDRLMSLRLPLRRGEGTDSPP